MYLEFYGLSEKPFTQTPDPRFLYWNDAYRESLASLRYGILERKGFIAMVGEAGTGKTTLLRKLLDELGDEVVSVFLFNPNATFEEILEYTLSELGISSPSTKKLAMLQQLNEFLLAAFAEGRNTILLIDEAQDLDIDVLESLRLLSNLETAQDKILQIVLCGQPELADRLADPRIRQLKQRIAVRCRLDPLMRDELPLFLEARLAVAGGDGSLFLPETHDAIWQYSEGIPRLINTVCDNALLVGYALGRKTIDREVLQEVIIDLRKIDPREPIAPPPPPELTTDVAPPSDAAGTASATSPVGSPNVPKSPAPSPAPELAPAAESSPAIPVAPTQNGANPGAVAALLAVGLLLFAAVALFSNRTPAPVAHPLPAPPAAAEPADSADSAGGVPAASGPDNPTSRLAPVPTAAPAPSPAPAPSTTPVTTATPAPTTMPEPTATTMPATTSIGAGSPGDRLPSAASAPPVVSSQASPTRKELSPTFAAPAPQDPTTIDITTQSRVPDLGTARPAEADPPRPPAAEGSVPRLVTVRPGDTLAEIALRVYGRQTYTLLDLLGAVNPEIEDPSRIIAGAVLLFPSLEAQTRIVTADGGDLQVIALTTPSLRRALAAQNQLQSRMNRTVEIRTLSLHDGPDLYRVFLGAFTSPDEASRAADRLGPVLQK